jgi:hypothetical protein
MQWDCGHAFGRELRWRDPPRITPGLARDKCAGSAAALGDFKFRGADAACLLTSQRSIH